MKQVVTESDDSSEISFQEKTSVKLEEERKRNMKYKRKFEEDVNTISISKSKLTEDPMLMLTEKVETL